MENYRCNCSKLIMRQVSGQAPESESVTNDINGLIERWLNTNTRPECFVTSSSLRAECVWWHSPPSETRSVQTSSSHRGVTLPPRTRRCSGAFSGPAARTKTTCIQVHVFFSVECGCLHYDFVQAGTGMWAWQRTPHRITAHVVYTRWQQNLFFPKIFPHCNFPSCQCGVLSEHNQST